MFSEPFSNTCRWGLETMERCAQVGPYRVGLVDGTGHGHGGNSTRRPPQDTYPSSEVVRRRRRRRRRQRRGRRQRHERRPLAASSGRLRLQVVVAMSERGHEAGLACQLLLLARADRRARLGLAAGFRPDDARHRKSAGHAIDARAGASDDAPVHRLNRPFGRHWLMRSRWPGRYGQLAWFRESSEESS